MPEIIVRIFTDAGDIPLALGATLPNVFPQRYAFIPQYQATSEPELAVLARIVQQTSVYGSWKAFQAKDLVPSRDGSQWISDWFETLGVLTNLMEYGIVELWKKRGMTLRHGLYVAPTTLFVGWVQQARAADALFVTK